MPLCITRVMWSALLTNENEALGAWIDGTLMLMAEMGTKQAGLNLCFAQGWFNGHLLALSFGSLGSTSDALMLRQLPKRMDEESEEIFTFYTRLWFQPRHLLPCQRTQKQSRPRASANILVQNPGFAFPGAVRWGGSAGPKCSPDGELWFIPWGINHCHLPQNLFHYCFHWEKLSSLHY